eukprot:546322-Rhodomonas_salina.1
MMTRQRVACPRNKDILVCRESRGNATHKAPGSSHHYATASGLGKPPEEHLPSQFAEQLLDGSAASLQVQVPLPASLTTTGVTCQPRLCRA